MKAILIKGKNKTGMSYIPCTIKHINACYSYFAMHLKMGDKIIKKIDVLILKNSFNS